MIIRIRHGLFIALLITSVCFVVADSWANGWNMWETHLGQCKIDGFIDSFGFDHIDVQKKKKSSGDIERFFHHLLQKVIDIWYAIVMTVLEFVCSLFESLGFRCG